MLTDLGSERETSTSLDKSQFNWQRSRWQSCFPSQLDTVLTMFEDLHTPKQSLVPCCSPQIAWSNPFDHLNCKKEKRKKKDFEVSLNYKLHLNVICAASGVRFLSRGLSNRRHMANRWCRVNPVQNNGDSLSTQFLWTKKKYSLSLFFVIEANTRCILFVGGI